MPHFYATLLFLLSVSAYACLGIYLVASSAMLWNYRGSFFVSTRGSPIKTTIVLVSLYLCPLVGFAWALMEEKTLPCALLKVWTHLTIGIAFTLFLHKSLKVNLRLAELTRMSEYLRAKKAPHPRTMQISLRVIKALSGWGLMQITVFVTLLNLTFFVADPLNWSEMLDDRGYRFCTTRSATYPASIWAAWMAIHFFFFRKIDAEDSFYMNLKLQVCSLGVLLSLLFYYVPAWFFSAEEQLVGGVFVIVPIFFAVGAMDSNLPVHQARTNQKASSVSSVFTFPLMDILCFKPTLKLLIKHLWVEWSPENIYFLRDATVFLACYRNPTEVVFPEMVEDFMKLYKGYLNEEAPFQVNISFDKVRKLHKLAETLKKMRDTRDLSETVAHPLQSPDANSLAESTYSVARGNSKRTTHRLSTSICIQSVVNLVPQREEDKKSTPRNDFGMEEEKKPISAKKAERLVYGKRWFESFREAIYVLSSNRRSNKGSLESATVKREQSTNESFVGKRQRLTNFGTNQEFSDSDSRSVSRHNPNGPKEDEKAGQSTSSWRVRSPLGATMQYSSRAPIQMQPIQTKRMGSGVGRESNLQEVIKGVLHSLSRARREVYNLIARDSLRRFLAKPEVQKVLQEAVAAGKMVPSNGKSPPKR